LIGKSDFSIDNLKKRVSSFFFFCDLELDNFTLRSCLFFGWFFPDFENMQVIKRDSSVLQNELRLKNT
jgi:hypothetical protein